MKISQVDSARDLATIAPRPVLIIHSGDGRLFPVYHAQKMCDAVQVPKDLWITGILGGQDPALAYKVEYRRRVVAFFERAFVK